MFKTILVPIDVAHLDEGRAALGIARAYAGADARITLLNVVEEIPGYVAAELPPGTTERTVKDSRNQLQALAADGGANVVVDVRIGQAYRTILDAAGENNVDLVVIASHRPGMQDYFLGSTAARVVRHAACSVLVVR